MALLIRCRKAKRGWELIMATCHAANRMPGRWRLLLGGCYVLSATLNPCTWTPHECRICLQLSVTESSHRFLIIRTLDRDIGRALLAGLWRGDEMRFQPKDGVRHNTRLSSLYAWIIQEPGAQVSEFRHSKRGAWCRQRET